VRRSGVNAFAGAVAIIFGGLPTARGADLPGRYDPVQPAPVNSSFYDWSGPYVGAHIGFGWGQATFSDPVLTPGRSLRNDMSGAIGGGQFGYNYHYGSLVFGFEFDISGAGISGDTTDVAPFAGDRYHTDITVIGALTARLGYAWANNLFYVKGGGAGADTRYQYTPISFGDNTVTQAQTTRWGWIVGVGWEYGFTQNWTAKLEYNYIDFGKEVDSLVPLTSGFDATIDHQIHLIKFGANFRWNGMFNNGQPVARYDGLAPGRY
jgi:outer membrane immunogenic protein